jgi:tripartite-type tricarboxylate transporter receptor subunit TctC
MLKTGMLLLAGLVAFCAPALAQNYPDRPVTIIVGFGKGGPDTNARLLAAQLNSQTGGNFVVENKPGAGGLIGAEAVIQAPHDGYTLLMTSAALATLPALHKKLSFDPLKDFVPISLIARSEASFLIASPTLDVKNLQEFIAYTKSNPVTYGSSGIGSSSHLRMAMFAAANKLEMTHLPFKSTGDSLASVMNGETQALFVTASQAIPFIKENKVRALAYDNDTRASFLPDVPTLQEGGATPTGMDSGWNGLLAPTGTPPEVIAWLEREVQSAIANPEVRAKIEALGLIPVGGNSAEFAQTLATAVDRMGAAVEVAGIKPQ